MISDRRHFFAAAPLLALAIEQLTDPLHSTAQELSSADQEALDFWIRGMGIHQSSIPSAGADYIKSGHSKGGSIDREPIFVHYLEDEEVLVTSDQIDKKYLAASGDTQVTMQLVRLRLNDTDNKKFSKYTSGGIYMDMQQHPELSAPGDLGFVHMATSLFSAFTTPASDKTETGKKATKQKGSKGSSPEQPAPASASKAGQSVPLQQQQTDSQSITLANGAGKAMFVAFVKDPRQSAFGEFIAAMSKQSTAPYARLLSIPFLASPALGAIRTMVANLQMHGSNQAMIMKSTPLDLVSTTTAVDAVEGPVPVRVRKGSYIAVPQEHRDILKPDMTKLKNILNGHLVPGSNSVGP